MMMQRNLYLAFSVFLGLFLTNVCSVQGAQNVGKQPFVGLWQAIDTFDGSTQYLSIVCARDKSCDVRLNDTAFTLSCNNQIGVAYGVGSIERNVLTVDFKLYCSNLDGTSTLAGTQVNQFVLDSANTTLTNLNDDPVPMPNVFHRISR